MPGPDCPSAADLKAYLLGDLPEAASRLLADHLGMCAACEAAARQLDAVTDPLIYSLRRVFRRPAPERPGAVPDPA
jgi:anti-sigma factor RsiW